MTTDENQTLGMWLNAQKMKRPHTSALIDSDGALSYAQLSDEVAALCTGFAGLDIGKGDVVAMQLPNIRSFVIAFLAVTARGGILQTLHMPYRSSEIQSLLSDSGAKAVIVTNSKRDSRTHDVLSVQNALPALDHVIVASDPPEECIALSDLMATVPVPSDVIDVSTDDEYLLLYTSGTTAAPKGVPHNYRGFLNNALDAAREMQIGTDSRILSLAPMSHLYGLFTMHLSLASGATMVLLPTMVPQSLPSDIRASKATHIYAAPAHFAPLVAQDALSSDHLSSAKLLCLSGAAVPRALAEAVDNKMKDGAVIQLWGMSELQAGTFGRPDDPPGKRFSTSGTAAPNTEIRVVDDDGVTLGPGQEGALQVRGPSVFAGYLNRPDETARALDGDGWFATGDLATMDADGYMAITGRTKEIINRGGVKFNPVEVEEILAAHPAIQQCAIIPVPDADLGERACLCVQLAPDTDLALDDALAALSAAGMAKYKWPEQLVVLDDLPTTPTRKIMRGKLSEIVEIRKDRR